MSQQTHERERDFEPNGFLYGLIFHLVRPLLKLFFKLDVKVDPELVGLDGPILLMANHLSYMDPLVAAMAIPWRKINFVAGRALYENKLLGWLLRKMNCIPKEQFYPDPGAIKEMFHILRRGGVTLVFPEGQRSIAGGHALFRRRLETREARPRHDPRRETRRAGFRAAALGLKSAPRSRRRDGRAVHDG